MNMNHLAADIERHPIVRRILEIGVAHDLGDIHVDGLETVLERYGLLGAFLELRPSEQDHVAMAVISLGEKAQLEEMLWLSRTLPE